MNDIQVHLKHGNWKIGYVVPISYASFMLDSECKLFVYAEVYGILKWDPLVTERFLFFKDDDSTELMEFM